MQTADLVKNIKFYRGNYDILPISIKTQEISNRDKTYIGNKENKVCRFCGKTFQQTSFKNVAHAIPELIGNKILISFEECDICNNLFSNYENELASYLNFARPAVGVKGKKGYPKYKDNKGLQIEHKETNQIKIQDILGSGNVSIDEENKEILVNGVRGAYIPQYVYKCFVKMALSIMKNDQLENFKETIKWLKDIKGDGNGVPLKCYYQFIPGVKPFVDIEMCLAYRKNTSSENTPYCIFCVGFANYYYQIYIPFASPDFYLEGKNFRFVLFPNRYYCNEEFQHKIQGNIKDFSSCEKVRGEEEKMSYSYDEKKVLSREEITKLENKDLK